LQTKRAGDPAAAGADPAAAASTHAVEQVVGASGQPLDSGTRGFMESRFGHDFGGVRVHADARAARAADAVQALAYTVGDDVVFGAGRYAPASDEGKLLIAHELAHVVQQRAAPVDAGAVEPAGSPAEREAASAASAAMRGGTPVALTATPRGLSRDVGWAQRGPIPDPYGMGYNTILTSAGAAAEPAVRDLASLEQANLSVNLAAFAALPDASALAVLALQTHATGTACEPWFPLLRAVTDPYGGATRITAHLFTGRTDRRALIIGGVHNRTEPQGAAVVDRLRALLASRATLGTRPFFTVILVPDLFARSRYSPGDPRWVQGGMGRDTSGTLSTNRPVEPNRNFPVPGEDLAATRARGSSGPNAPELVFTDPANPTAAPRPAHDTSIAGGGGTSIRMLPETRTLVSLIEHFHPERIASVHAHSLKNLPGDAPGIFVDPRGVNPTTGAVTNAAQAAEDDRLAAAMVRTGRNSLASTPIAGAPSDPFVGNVPPTGGSTVRYASGVHAEGNSLGTWAPAPVASGPGARAGITTITMEVPQWRGSGQATQLGQIEDLDRDLLADIFLEDPAVVTPATAPTTP
jgi:hypothetical protein